VGKGRGRGRGSGGEGEGVEVLTGRWHKMLCRGVGRATRQMELIVSKEESHGVIPQKTAFSIVSAVKTLKYARKI
jgi:hypothetical protein